MTFDIPGVFFYNCYQSSTFLMQYFICHVCGHIRFVLRLQGVKNHGFIVKHVNWLSTELIGNTFMQLYKPIIHIYEHINLSSVLLISFSDSEYRVRK